MNQNLTFEHDTYSRKVSRYFLWLYVGILILVMGSLVLQFHSVAFVILFLTLLMTGALLRRLHGRYQVLDVVKEKHRLEQEAYRLQEKLAVVQKSLTETKQRREHLLQKEQFGLEATLRNQQIHHVQKRLSSCFIKDAPALGLFPQLKERLEGAGIRTALDVSEEAIAGIEGLDTAGREVLFQWRSSLAAQFEATQPVKLPDHQLEYIQKKFNRQHARNDEKESSLIDIVGNFVV
jgi:DNA-binding helix-hairpin-helix protein with protein kinase domain